MNDSTCLEYLGDGSVKVHLPIFTGLNRRSRFFIDPATAAEIASAAADYFKNRDEREWKVRVGDKLDAVLEKMEEIVRAIAAAVDKIVANDNENWSDFYTTSLKHPGLTWETLSQRAQPLDETEREYIAATFRDKFAPAVGSITLNGKFRSLGFVLAPVVRLAFPYTMLALKLARNKLPPLMARDHAVIFAYDYLVVSVAEDDPSSLASILNHLNSRLAEKVTYMDAWANNHWVRVSDIRPARRASGRNSGGDEEGSPASMRVARLIGGANDPKIAETAVVFGGDPLFGIAEYQGFPGSIGVDEDEKARIYLTSHWINPNVADRTSLAAKISALAEQVNGIRAELPLIKDWIETVV